MKDEQTGISIRFIRQWRPEPEHAFTALDMALVSCATLGRTWRLNEGEPFCGVCGAPNLRLQSPDQVCSTESPT